MDPLFRLNSDVPTPAPGVKVLKAADVDTLHDAASLIEAAKAHAAEIEKKAEAVYEERYQQGYEDGVEFGKMENAEKMMETVLASVEFIESIENTVVSVVNQSIRKIIGELDDEERIKRIVGTALNTVRGQQRVTVRVNPSEEPTGPRARAATPSGSCRTVVADPRLGPDSCILESELGVVDASLETQLKALEHAFTSKIRQ